ncbi:hypothetical protein TB1_022433 [Malus domestica]
MRVKFLYPTSSAGIGPSNIFTESSSSSKTLDFPRRVGTGPVKRLKVRFKLLSSGSDSVRVTGAPEPDPSSGTMVEETVDQDRAASSSSNSSPFVDHAKYGPGDCTGLTPFLCGGGVDFNFWDEEFQVQLALAISASDPGSRDNPETAQIDAIKRISLGCSASTVTDTQALRTNQALSPGS